MDVPEACEEGLVQQRNLDRPSGAREQLAEIGGPRKRLPGVGAQRPQLGQLAERLRGKQPKAAEAPRIAEVYLAAREPKAHLAETRLGRAGRAMHDLAGHPEVQVDAETAVELQRQMLAGAGHLAQRPPREARQVAGGRLSQRRAGSRTDLQDATPSQKALQLESREIDFGKLGHAARRPALGETALAQHRNDAIDHLWQ